MNPRLGAERAIPLVKDIGWNHEDGAIRIVMTGTASDRPGLQDHVYSKGQKKRLAKRFKDAKDPPKLVIVRDMWMIFLSTAGRFRPRDVRMMNLNHQPNE